MHTGTASRLACHIGVVTVQYVVGYKWLASYMRCNMVKSTKVQSARRYI